MSNTILITGGGGFLGKNLIKYYKENFKNFNIIVLDNFSSSCDKEFFKFIDDEHLENVVKLFKLDITQPFAKIVDNFLSENKTWGEIGQVYHFASIASPIYYKKMPLETLEVGYTGTKNVLDFVLKICPKAKVLFTSTSEVYGDPCCSPQKETYYGNVNSFGERSCYDESKRVAEALIYSYIKIYGLDVRIARVFNTYGPYMSLNDGRIVTEIMKSIIHKTKLKIFNGGKQTRSLCYVTDLIDMLVKLCNRKNRIYYPVNCGNADEISINDLVILCEKLFNVKIDYEYSFSDTDDPKIRIPDLTLNYQILGYRDFISKSSGLEILFKYFSHVNSK